MLTDKRAERMQRIGEENYQRFLAWASAHPGATQGEAAHALGLSRTTINKYVKRWRDEHPDEA